MEVNLEKLINQILNKGQIVQELHGGMMNHSYLVKGGDKKNYILYIPTEQANEMVDRVLEKEHQQIAYSLGITSKCVYFDSTNGIKMNEFIEGTSIDKVKTFDFQKVADLLRVFHSSKTLSKINYEPFKRFVNEYEKEALSFQNEVSKDYQKLRDFLFKYKDYLESQKLVLSHNDAQRSNIIKDENDNYWLIDFEFVGNNDEIYDIAAFGNGVVKEGRILLDHYFDMKPDLDQIKRYYLWRIYISLQWYNVAITKHYRGEGKAHGFDFLAVATHFLNNALDAYNGFLKEIK